jgi:transposase, IS6 family
MHARGLDVDDSTVFRWVQRYAPEINKRMRPHLKISGTSYRVDETYIKVGKTCKYLYRAVDQAGQAIELVLSAKCDISAAKRFLKKMMRAEHRRLPFSISVDKNASYPEAFNTSQSEGIMPQDCQLRRVQYLNNVIEQDHRFVKKKVRASQCFKRFHAAQVVCHNSTLSKLSGTEGVSRVCRERFSSAMDGDDKNCTGGGECGLYSLPDS